MTTTRSETPALAKAGVSNDLDAYAGAASTPHYTHLDGKGKTSELLTALGLGRAGLIEVKCINPAYTHPDNVRMFWKASAGELLRDWPALEELNRNGWHIYYGVASFKSDSGEKVNIAQLLTAHTDLDGKDYVDDEADWRTGKAIARGLLDALPAALQPSALVDSGHGYHAYWILRDALPATSETIAQVEAVNAALAAWLDGDKAVKDASRVLRLPGFRNVKADPLPVVLEFCNDRRFDLADFAPIMPAPKATPAAKTYTNGTDPRPGDEFNARGSWPELLTGHGWAEVGSKGQSSYWRRPGKNDGISARLNRDGDGLLRVFSSNAQPLEVQSYSLFAAYAAFEYGGSYSEAAKALAAKGYGTPKASKAASGEVLNTATGEVVNLLGGANDEVNARLTHAIHGERFVCSEALGWLSYDGQRWRNEGAEAAVDRAIVKTLEERISAAFATGEAEAYDKLIKYCAPNAQRIKGAKYNLSSLAAATVEKFDADPDALNTPAGVVDLRTGLVTPHSSAQRFMHVTAVDYDPHANQSAWLGWLSDAFNHDREVLSWLQMAAGYTVTGRTSEEVLFYLHGKPRAGKGLFTETLAVVLGPQLSAELGFETFTRDRSGDTQNFDLAPLKTTRFVAASESQSYERFNEAKLKRLTGGNLVWCAHKFGAHFNYRPQFKIWLSSNHPINADPDDDAVWSRIRLVEFPNSYLGNEDKTLKVALRQPAALRGVLAWLVEGAQKWYALGSRGLPELQRFIVAKDEQRAEVDHVQQWIDDCCLIGAGWTTSQALHASYHEWCASNGVQAKHSTGLSSALKAKGYEPERKTTARGFLGIMVRP